MKNVVVTGATSMLGAALIRGLLQRKSIEKIYAVVRPYTRGGQMSLDSESAGGLQAEKRKRLPSDERISIVECDLQDYDKLPSLINDECEVFYHLAWPRTATYTENIDDTLLKCEAMKGVLQAVKAAEQLKCSKFVGTGSQSEYGLPPSGIYTAEMPCNPVRIDGVIHLAAGQAGRLLAEQYGITFIWLRIFSVYGINDRKNSMISSTMEKLLTGIHCSFTKCEQTWDYVYEDDVADAFILVGEKSERSEVYNVAAGESKPLREYIEIMRDIVSPGEILSIGEIPYPKNPIMKMEVDISKLQRDTGWQAKTTFADGIRCIYNSLKNGKLSKR